MNWRLFFSVLQCQLIYQHVITPQLWDFSHGNQKSNHLRSFQSNISKMSERSQTLRGCSVVARPQVASCALRGRALSAFSGYLPEPREWGKIFLALEDFKFFIWILQLTIFFHLPFFHRHVLGFLGALALFSNKNIPKSEHVFPFLPLQPFDSNQQLPRVCWYHLLSLQCPPLELRELDSSFRR